MSNAYQCEYCGHAASTIQSLTGSTCQRHPAGPGRGKHKLYEGPVASRYACKYCGQSYSSLQSLTGSTCQRHPDGPGRGRHAPALRA